MDPLTQLWQSTADEVGRANTLDEALQSIDRFDVTSKKLPDVDEARRQDLLYALNGSTEHFIMMAKAKEEAEREDAAAPDFEHLQVLDAALDVLDDSESTTDDIEAAQQAVTATADPQVIEQFDAYVSHKDKGVAHRHAGRMAGRENLVLVERERKIGDKSHSWHYWVKQAEVKATDRVLAGSTVSLRTEQPTESHTLTQDEKGISVTKKLTFADGTHAYYKPASGEEFARLDIPQGQSYLREAAASKLGDLMGMGAMVPHTVLRDDLEDGIGSVQAAHQPKPISEDLVKRLTTEANDRVGPAWGKLKIKPESIINRLTDDPETREKAGLKDDVVAFQKLRAFDLITGNTDRHPGNWLPSYEGNVRTPLMIDHGLCFPTQTVPTMTRVAPVVSQETRDAPVHESVRAMVTNLDTAKVVKLLKDEGLTPGAVYGTAARLEYIKANPRQIAFGTPPFKFAANQRYDLPQKQQAALKDLMQEHFPGWKPNGPLLLPYKEHIAWEATEKGKTK